MAPFFSPDSQWIAFFTPTKLKKISAQGGTATELCGKTSSLGLGGSWGEDGNIIAALGNYVLSRVPPAGGDAEPVSTLAKGEAAHRWPQILPGGREVLFTSFKFARGVEGTNVELLSLRDGRRKILQRGATYGRYLPSGHLVYVREGTLFAAPFDLKAMEFRGAALPILSEVWYNTTFGSSDVDFSATGTLLYRASGAVSYAVQLLDTKGGAQTLMAARGDYSFERLSPDGTRLALTSSGDIWVYEWRRDVMTRVTSGGGHDVPIWTPNGEDLVFQSPTGLSWARADGAAKEQSLTQSRNMLFPKTFSPDGRRLWFDEFTSERGSGHWLVPIESDGRGLRAGQPEDLAQSVFAHAWGPAFSPDGRWLAYSSNESGTSQIYVRAFPDRGSRWQVSTAGGSMPLWSPGRRDMYFRSPDNQIMIADYSVKADSFQPGKPRTWNEKGFVNAGSIENYGVAPDGRIVAPMPAEQSEAKRARSHVIFLLNFFDELRRRVPAGK
jgi:serine/threonine-protein kinase